MAGSKLTEQKLLNGNTLIVEFMNGMRVDWFAEKVVLLPYDKNDMLPDSINRSNYIQYAKAYVLDTEVKYHRSWSWLMPVAEKAIQNLLGDVSRGSFRIESKLKEAILNFDIEETWKWCVELIKHHNKKLKI